MKLVYAPEGAEPREFDFDPSRLMSPEIEVIERQTGMTYGQWIEAMGNGSFTAFHGLLYIMLKRTAPTLKWNDVQFSVSDIDFQMDDEEAAALRKALEDKRQTHGLDDIEEEQLRSLIAEGVELPDDGAGDAPKEE